MPWNDAPLDSITVPSDALPYESHVYVGDDDPLLDSFGEDSAGIVWYASEDVGLAMRVTNDVADPITDPPFLKFDIDMRNLAPGAVAPSASAGAINWDTTDGTLQVVVGDQGAGGLTSNRYNQTLITGTDINITPYNGVGVVGDGGILSIGRSNPGASPVDRSDFQVYGTSLARGKCDEAYALGVSGAIVAAETAVLTIASRTYYAGRAYTLRHIGGAQVSVLGASPAAFFRFRKTNVAGQDLGELFRFPIVATGAGGVVCANGERTFTVGGTDVTAALCITLSFSGGATGVHYGNAVTARVLEAWDVGEAADFGHAPVLV